MKNFFAHFSSKLSSDVDAGKWQPRPDRDWRRIFFIFSGFLFVILSIQAYLYLYVSSHDTFFQDNNTEGSISQSASIRQKELSRIVILFAAKKARMDQLVASPISLPDPGAATFSSSPGPLPVPKTKQKSGTSQKASSNRLSSQ